MSEQPSPETWTEKIIEYFARARVMATKYRSATLEPLHLTYVFYKDRQSLVNKIGQSLGQDRKKILLRLRERCLSYVTNVSGQTVDVGQSLNAMFESVYRHANVLKSKKISEEHFLLALCEYREFQELLKHGGLDIKMFTAGLKKHIDGLALLESSPLNQYGEDLTLAAQHGKLDPVIGREEEIKRCIEILNRKRKNNPLLLGDPGVGKTAIVEGLAQKIIASDVPKNLKSRLISLDVGNLMAGTKYRGEFEERMKTILNEITNSKEPTILFIDEIHMMLGAGKGEGGNIDAANLLKPVLARGTLRCIGATTVAEYRKYVESDPAFERRFQPVTVNEPSKEDTLSILRGLKYKFQYHHGVIITDSALIAAVELSTRYIHGRFQPDKSIDLIDEACSRIRVQLDSHPEAYDKIQRNITHCEIETRALRGESNSTQYQAQKNKLAQFKTQLAQLQTTYQAEKQQLEDLRQFQLQHLQLENQLKQFRLTEHLVNQLPPLKHNSELSNQRST